MGGRSLWRAANETVPFVWLGVYYRIKKLLSRYIGGWEPEKL